VEFAKDYQYFITLQLESEGETVLVGFGNFLAKNRH